MTNTQLVTAGALAAAGANVSNAIKATLGATTKVVTVEVIVTNGAIPSAKKSALDLFIAFSNVDGVAATLATQFQQSAYRKTLNLKEGRAEVTYLCSKPLIPTGAVIYVWLGNSDLPAAGTVDIWLNEIQ
jgi:hypothetical protein